MAWCQKRYNPCIVHTMEVTTNGKNKLFLRKTGSRTRKTEKTRRKASEKLNKKNDDNKEEESEPRSSSDNSLEK